MIDLNKSKPYALVMKPDCVRTSLDLPHQAAARNWTSARQLILNSIEKALDEQTPRPPRQRLSLDEPIVPSRGKPFAFSHEEIYDLIDFP